MYRLSQKDELERNETSLRYTMYQKLIKMRPLTDQIHKYKNIYILFVLNPGFQHAQSCSHAI